MFKVLTLIIKIFVERLVKGKRPKRAKEKEQLIKIFGKTRYYLSLWFGRWVLFAWNRAR